MIETLGHYRILDRLGAGGIGDVYRARDTRVGRTVLIKILRPEIASDAAARERFLDDARAAERLSHPNIAALEEIGEDHGRVYLVFEFASGSTLKALVGGRPLNPRRAIDYAVQIADALADIHAQGLVHRDVKPDNIIITSKGAAKLLDVGLSAWTAGGAARRKAAAAPDTLTTPADRETAAYMSPEQAIGGTSDHRTDIFSLGVVLFEMLTGRHPFAADTAAAIPLQIMRSAVPHASASDQAIPKAIDTILGRMLAKSLDARYSSAATVAAELRAVASVLGARSQTAEVQETVPGTQTRETSRIGWIVAAIVVIAVVVLVWAATRVQ